MSMFGNQASLNSDNPMPTLGNPTSIASSPIYKSNNPISKSQILRNPVYFPTPTSRISKKMIQESVVEMTKMDCSPNQSPIILRKTNRTTSKTKRQLFR